MISLSAQESLLLQQSAYQTLMPHQGQHLQGRAKLATSSDPHRTSLRPTAWLIHPGSYLQFFSLSTDYDQHSPDPLAVHGAGNSGTLLGNSGTLLGSSPIAPHYVGPPRSSPPKLLRALPSFWTTPGHQGTAPKQLQVLPSPQATPRHQGSPSNLLRALLSPMTTPEHQGTALKRV